MTAHDETKSEASPSPERERTPLPQRYRQGTVTAITVLLGFFTNLLPLLGLRGGGRVDPRSVFVTSILIVSVIMQIIALFRSLQIADDEEIEYGKTVGWFVASAVVLFIAVLIAVVVFSGVFDAER